MTRKTNKTNQSKFQLQKLGRTIDLKIKSKLYFLQFKKNFSHFFAEFFSFQVMKFAIPSLVLAIFSISYFQFLQTSNNSNISNTSTEIIQNVTKSNQKNISNKTKYLALSKQRLLNTKNTYFKKYSKLRKEKIKLISMK